MGPGHLRPRPSHALIQDFIPGMLFKATYFHSLRTGHLSSAMSLGDDRCCSAVYMNIPCLKEGLECYEFTCCTLQIYSISQYICDGLNEALTKNWCRISISKMPMWLLKWMQICGSSGKWPWRSIMGASE